jgi:hypothetical protein
MITGHAVAYSSRKDSTDRETYIDGPIRCSLLMMECEENLTRKM